MFFLFYSGIEAILTLTLLINTLNPTDTTRQQGQVQTFNTGRAGPITRANSANSGLFRLDTDNSLTCFGRCTTKGHDPQKHCQCNEKCSEFSDCCPDYEDACLLCKNRCFLSYNRALPCQCNRACPKYKNCCKDFQNICTNDDDEDKDSVVGPGHGSTTGTGSSSSETEETEEDGNEATDLELGTLSETLLTEDTNNVGNLITVNLQGRTSTSQHSSDKAPNPLLVVQGAAYEKPSIAKVIKLLDNYEAHAGSPEDQTPAEKNEESQFLDIILPTKVMTRLRDFLFSKRYLTSRSNSLADKNKSFRDALDLIWFGLYSRENRVLGSSGFEHVFLGELKNGQVSGLHNWIFFSLQEAGRKLNYKGHLGGNVSLGNKGMIVKQNFEWNNTTKPVSSMFVGTSPEFEIAVYTLCFYARPGNKCPIKLNGKPVNIQTHYLARQRNRYIGSAYPDI